MGNAPEYGTATLRVSAADANSAKTDILDAIRILKQFPSDPDIKLMLNGAEISGTDAIPEPENANIMVENRTAAITENNLGGGGRRRRTNRRNMRKRSTRRRR